MAKELEKEKVKTTEMVSKISELTGFSKEWIRHSLPKKYKTEALARAVVKTAD